MSPIEDRLLGALCALTPTLFLHAAAKVVWKARPPFHPRPHLEGEDGDWFSTDGDHIHERAPELIVELARNVRINSYRVDFLAGLDGRPGLLAIECDGHEWHDRTKQQAAYDRSRDRELLRMGILTIRFTGSEIVHSAERCAQEVLDSLRIFEREAGDEQYLWVEAIDYANRWELRRQLAVPSDSTVPPVATGWMLSEMG